MSNWIQTQYGLGTQLTLPHPATGREQTAVVVGYTYNERGRADGITIRSSTGRVVQMDWLALSRLRAAANVGARTV